MACPESSVLESVLNGTAASAVEIETARHLDGCEACRRTMEDLAGGSAWHRAERRVPRGLTEEPGPDLAAARERLQAATGELFHDGAAAADGGAGGVEGEGGPRGGGEVFDFLLPGGEPGVMGRFGGYDVLEHVASGGMGIVFRARDTALARVVALKVLAPALARHPVARSRFIREARAAAAVVHEHVVGIHAVEECSGLPYLVMQYVKGRSLAERLRATGPMRLEEMLRIGAQIAAGLSAAHAQGVIHRDVKPGNVLLENSVERVKLTDFGLARAADDPSLTRTGEIAGTPEFMSPEQAMGQEVDARSDLFSLGVILYAMATGASPFRAPGTVAVLRRVCDLEPASLATAAPGIPVWFADAVARLMAKRPADRFGSAAEVAAFLEDGLRRIQREGAVDESGSGRSPTGRPAVRRAMGMVALVLVGLGAWAWWGGWGRGGKDIPSGAGVVGAPAAPADGVHSRMGVVATEGNAASVAGEEGYWILASVAGPRGALPIRTDTLAGAVAAAGAGDTIELRFNGLQRTEPFVIPEGKPLRIVAGSGFRPVLGYGELSRPLVSSSSALILEGGDI